MTGSIASGKAPTSSTSGVHQQRDSHARSRSISLGQLPRSFEYGEDFLAQSAAAAYQANPAYVAIEKETLNAVAPFLEISKRRDRSASTTSNGLAASRSYSHNHKHSGSTSTELSSSPSKLHERTTSGSSVTFDEFRNSVKTVSALPQSVIPEDSLPGPEGARDQARSNQARRQSVSTGYGSDSVGNAASLHSSRVPSFSSPASPLNLSTQQIFSLGQAYGLTSASPQQLDLMQNRLRSLSIGSNRARRNSTSTSVPLVAPDPAFLLTKFIRDSIRLYSPSQAEIEEKSRLRCDLESILQIVQPTASLSIFGSVKNGLALANADLDLMVVDSTPIEEQLHDLHVDLPGLYAEALKSQGYSVKLLTKTRIPLIKIQREYIAGVFSVDISFDNPLALHNTRLIATYSACDSRFGVLVMFIKLWTRARRINDSFAGTLKSYGYIIMLIYFLQNKVTPALLPNLQMIAASGRAVNAEELECQGFDIWYAKDVSRMQAIQQNTQSVGELLEGFYSHFAYEFDYRDWVVSINVFGGLQTKESKRWTQLVEHMNENGSARVKDRFILCISDPFEISHNVARTVTRTGLYDIRGSMMAAVRAIRGNKLTDLLVPNI